MSTPTTSPASRRRPADLRRALLPCLLAIALGANLTAHAADATPAAATAQDPTTRPDDATARKTKTLQTIQVHGVIEPTYGDSGVARRTRLGVLGDQDLMDTPFATTSYTSEYIQAAQAKTIGEALADDPAVRTTMGYGNFAEMFIIRGFPLNGDDIAFDGLYGVMPRQMVAAETIGRLDVLRGASAFLYGVSPAGSGIGGTINVEPKWATDAPINRLTADYTGNSEFGGQLDWGRRFGNNNEYGLRINLGDRGGNSSIQNEYHRSNYESIAFDFRGERFRFNADIAHQKEEIDNGRSVVYLTGDGVPRPPRASANYSEPWAYSSLEDTYGVARAEYDIMEDLTAYAAVGFDHSNESGEYVSPSVDGHGNGSFYRLGVPYQNDSVAGEAGLNGAFETGSVSHKVNLGISAGNTRKTVGYSFGYLAGYQSPSTSLYDMSQIDYLDGSDISSEPGVTGRTKLRSLALSDTLGFWNDQVLLTLGVRRQKLQVFGYNYPASGGGMTSSYNKTVNSPAIGLVVKLGDEWSLFVNSIQALTEGPTPDATAANRDAVFKPSRSKQVETGVKFDHGDFGSTFSLFQIKEPNGFTDPVTRIFSVSGEQRNRGAEWSFYGEPVQGLRLNGGVTVISPKLTKTDDATTQGNYAIGVPKWQYNAGADWAVPYANGLRLNAELVRTGPQYVNETNTLHLAAWTRVDVGAAWPTKLEGKDVTFRANVINVGNSNYWASAQSGYVVQGLPRTVKLSVTLDF